MESQTPRDNPYASPTFPTSTPSPTPTLGTWHLWVARAVATLVLLVVIFSILNVNDTLPYFCLVVAITAPIRASKIHSRYRRGNKVAPSPLGVLLFSYILTSILLFCAFILFMATCSALGKPARYFMDPTPLGLIVSTIASLGFFFGALALSIKMVRC